MSTMSMKARKKASNTLVYIILTVLGIIWLFPIIWIVLTSFRAEGTANVPYFIPKTYTIQNYVKLFTSDIFNFKRWFLNTFIVATGSCLLSTFINVSVAYVMSRLRFRLRRTYMNVALVLGMFPGFMSMIAIYYVLKAFGLTQSLVALILVYTALQAFISPWMDFIMAKMIMGDNYDKYTVAIGLWYMTEKENIEQYFTTFAAGSVCIAIPITILFIWLQKYYVSGVTGGSIK